MAITPGNNIALASVMSAMHKQEQPATTYRIDTNTNMLQGEIDGLDALVQRVQKELSTEKYRYSIYSWAYGLQTKDLIGADKEYAYLKLQRRIEECLAKYDEIIGIKDFNIKEVEGERDALRMSFTINSIYGDYEEEVDAENVY